MRDFIKRASDYGIMEQSLSRILVEVAAKTALKNIKENPGRGIRNIVDMALQCTEGRFQQRFFSTAQAMLQNENSAYYRLVQDTVLHTDANRLLTFGMNMGYNACTIGAQRIRKHERTLGFNIPWAVLLRINTQCMAETEQRYHEVIREGEPLGIYAWMLFSVGEAQPLLSLAKKHPDSAFCIFCETADLTEAFLDEAAEIYNVMLVVRYAAGTSECCAELRRRELLYSVWYLYGQADLDSIRNGVLFDAMQQPAPFFAALVPECDCPETAQHLVHEAVQRGRNEQNYRTILWEMLGDNRLIDTVISDDACSAYFDEDGDLYDQSQKIAFPVHNLFQDSLTDIFQNAYPKVCTEPAKPSQKRVKTGRSL